MDNDVTQLIDEKVVEAIIKKCLSGNTLHSITNIVIDRLRKEESFIEKMRYDRRIANTRLLLRNYRSLVDHFENSVYTASHVDVEAGLSLAEILGYINENAGDRLKVESIKHSTAKTKILISHIDAMLDIYRVFCENSPHAEDMRRYRIIHFLYLDDEPKTAEELAEIESTNRRTVYRDVTIAVEKLTALIFGADGIALRHK